MAAPQFQVFFLYDPATGAPVTGKVIGPGAGQLHFVTYLDDLGAHMAEPAITEIGGGAYGFEPVFTADQGIAYCIDCGTGVTPGHVAGYLRPEDYYTDQLTPALIAIIQAGVDLSGLDTKLERVLDNLEGTWAIGVTGPDANKLVLYRRNGTVLLRFALKDKNGLPTVINPYSRVME